MDTQQIFDSARHVPVSVSAFLTRWRTSYRLRDRSFKDDSRTMTRVEELESAIDALSADEYSALRDWFWERDWAKWDRQIEADAASGKLDSLVREARDAKARGTLRAL